MAVPPGDRRSRGCRGARPADAPTLAPGHRPGGAHRPPCRDGPARTSLRQARFPSDHGAGTTFHSGRVHRADRRGCLGFRTMRAVTVSEPGGPEALRWGEVPDPVCGPGEVIVDVAASAVNRADLLQRQGFYPPPPGASDILGLECSGVISEVGDGRDRLVGRRRGVRPALRRGLRRAGRRPGRAAPAPPGRRRAGHRGRAARGDLHRLVERLPAGQAPARRQLPRARRLQRHRHHGHPAGGAGRRAGVHHGRHPREARRLPRARRRGRPSTTATRTSSSGCGRRPTAPASTSSSTTWARSTWPATSTPWPSAAGW